MDHVDQPTYSWRFSRALPIHFLKKRKWITPKKWISKWITPFYTRNFQSLKVRYIFKIF